MKGGAKALDMKTVHKGEASELIKSIPKAPVYLDTNAKKHFKNFSKILISNDSLKRIHVPAVEILAENFSQWEWSVRQIRAKNKEKKGSGYVQRYNSGAENISVYLTIKRDAEKAIMQCFKQFGIDPKSEKELKQTVDPAQGDLFEEFGKLKKS